MMPRPSIKLVREQLRAAIEQKGSQRVRNPERTRAVLENCEKLCEAARTIMRVPGHRVPERKGRPPPHEDFVRIEFLLASWILTNLPRRNVLRTAKLIERWYQAYEIEPMPKLITIRTRIEKHESRRIANEQREAEQA